MGVRILHDTDRGLACLYDSTSGVAFGPVFEEHEDGRTAFEMAERFLAITGDARRCSPALLDAAWARAYQEVDLS
ncbi:MAG: hypothetical protein IT304_04725 [Dehalococcoidia bacterium]|nr:hypothetical protein [Dehalococcoidia bacterium]